MLYKQIYIRDCGITLGLSNIIEFDEENHIISLLVKIIPCYPAKNSAKYCKDIPLNQNPTISIHDCPRIIPWNPMKSPWNRHETPHSPHLTHLVGCQQLLPLRRTLWCGAQVVPRSPRRGEHVRVKCAWFVYLYRQSGAPKELNCFMTPMTMVYDTCN